MAADPVSTVLESVAELAEALATHERVMLDLIRQSNAQVAELGDGLLALSHRISSHYVAVRPMLVARSTMFTSLCADCGNEYVSEPGPNLCGPCWVRLGMPEEWPTPRASRA